MDAETWAHRQGEFRNRIGLAVIAGLATSTLYAEGVLKNGWIEVALLAPVLWFLFSPRNFFQNLLIVLSASCFAISLADAGLRPLISQRLHYTPTNIVSRKLPALPIVGRWDPNVVFKTAVYGDLAAMAGDPKLREPREILFQTDEAGFRNTQTTEKIDLIVLGDSFGAGVGTTQDRTFAQLLETQYGRRIYNLSYPGGPYDQFVNFAVEWPRLSPASSATLIWTFYTGNDLDDAGGKTWDLAALPWQGSFGQWLVRYRTYRNRSPLNQLSQTIGARWNDSTSGVIVRTLRDGRPVLFQSSHEAWGNRSEEEIRRYPNFLNLERTMVSMQALAAARGVEVVVVILPTKGEVYRWILDQRQPKPEDAASSGFAQSVLGLCQKMKMRCLDSKPYLEGEGRRLFESSGELLWWRDDTHLGEKGHEAVARFIAQKALGLRKPLPQQKPSTNAPL